MASTRALVPFAVLAAFVACSTHSSGSEAQAKPPETVTITVDQGQLNAFLEEEADNPLPEIETDPDPIKLRPGQTVSFRFEGGPWMLQPTPLSPFDRVVIHGQGGETVTVTVRDNAMTGVYKSIIAVHVDGRVFVTDPHFIIS